MGAHIPVHGHRGARSVAPENTIPSFVEAIEAGAEWIELDLWATKDDVLVVTHDAAMNQRICQGPEGAERVVRRLTLAEVKQWDCGALGNPDFVKQRKMPGTRVPTFDEVLDLAGKYPRFRFNVEIKSSPTQPDRMPAVEAYTRMVVEAIRRKGLAERVMIQSFDWRLVHEAGRIAPEMPRSALFPTSAKDMGKDFSAVAEEAGTKWVSVHYGTVTKDKVQSAHAAGIKVIAWTANTEEVWTRLVEAGVDEIITDDPRPLIAWLKARGLRQ
jgi:glycerophosphoryl diester phosphodiesterase